MYEGVIGVVLAGGRSSRMGTSKALLDFKGRPLVEHMLETLSVLGLEKVVISGKVPGYESIPDTQPFRGPAEAIKTIIQTFPKAKGFLFVPVDMPYLSPQALRFLLSEVDGAYFENSPLPAYIEYPVLESLQEVSSVQDVLDMLRVQPISLPKGLSYTMLNVNTPKEWWEAMAR